MIHRRAFNKTAAGALAAGLLPEASAQTVGLGRPPMKWPIQHSMQISDLNPRTLQLAKQLGMDYVNIWTSPDKYKEVARKDVLEGKVWSYPILANGKIFARSTVEGVCLDLN